MRVSLAGLGQNAPGASTYIQVSSIGGRDTGSLNFFHCFALAIIEQLDVKYVK